MSIYNAIVSYKKILDRAQGVWLWIYLVIHDLLRDIEDIEDYTSAGASICRISFCP
jgi:hypothetical protein